jgi:L-cysteine desulfidase
MLRNDGVEQTADNAASAGKSSCTALVPVVQTAEWSSRHEPPQTNSIFVTQLIAAEVQRPHAANPGQAAALNAFSAYRTASIGSMPTSGHTKVT